MKIVVSGLDYSFGASEKHLVVIKHYYYIHIEMIILNLGPPMKT